MEENLIDARIGLSSLHRERVWNGEGRGGSGTRSPENRTKVCEWMGYVVGDLGTSLGHGEVWIGVPVQCYMECNIESNWSFTRKRRLRACKEKYKLS